MGIDPVTHSPRLDLLDLSSILYASSSSCSSSTQDISNIQLNGLHAPLLNPHLLKLASSLFSSSQRRDHQNLNFCNNQIPHDTSLFQQIALPEISQPTIMAQPNVDPYNIPSNFSEFGDWQNNNNSNCGMMASNTQDYVPELLPTGFQYYSSDDNQSHQNLVDLQNINHYSNNNFHFASVQSTPSNSNSTYINGSSTTEDERESYNSSNMFNFEIPADLLDVNDFM